MGIRSLADFWIWLDMRYPSLYTPENSKIAPLIKGQKILRANA